MKTNKKSRNFLCSSCGKCCNHVPEVEIGETLDLYKVFPLFALFKEFSIPLHRDIKSIKSEEDNSTRENIKNYCGTSTIDARSKSSKHITISAIPFASNDRECSALKNDKCSIYEIRPISCRTVPLHYSVPPTRFLETFDAFVSTSGYECITDGSAPMFIENGEIIHDDHIAEARKRAISQARSDILWKKEIIKEIVKGKKKNYRLPEISLIRNNSRNHLITLSPMVDVWKIALEKNIIHENLFIDICKTQVSLIEENMNTEKDIEKINKLLFLRESYERYV